MTIKPLPELETKPCEFGFFHWVGSPCTGIHDQVLPVDKDARKAIPLARGLLDYFPAALAAVAEVSRVGNEKHNPGQPMHHARGKSGDHADCILRHLIDRGKLDPEDGLRHSAKVAWRALALLQEEIEAGGAPLARGAKVPTGTVLGVKACLHPPNCSFVASRFALDCTCPCDGCQVTRIMRQASPVCDSVTHPQFGRCALPQGHACWHGNSAGAWA